MAKCHFNRPTPEELNDILCHIKDNSNGKMNIKDILKMLGYSLNKLKKVLKLTKTTLFLF